MIPKNTTCVHNVLCLAEMRELIFGAMKTPSFRLTTIHVTAINIKRWKFSLLYSFHRDYLDVELMEFEKRFRLFNILSVTVD